MMLTSELISRLQGILNQQGDLPVYRQKQPMVFGEFIPIEQIHICVGRESEAHPWLVLFATYDGFDEALKKEQQCASA